MSEKKNGVSPFTDKEYLQSSSSANNKYKKQVTKKDIDEFEKVFADEDTRRIGTDGKGFFASFKTAKDKSAVPPVIQSAKSPAAPKRAEPESENLYEAQSFDIDSFMVSLGAAPTASQKTESTSTKKEEAEDHTRHFSLEKKAEKPKPSQKTKHFSLSNSVKEKINQSIPSSEKKENLLKEVRVLSEDKPEDEAIIEAAPTGEGQESLLDSLNPEKGEDIFIAIERAVKRKKNSVAKMSAEEAKKKAKKKKEEQVLLTGNALKSSLIKKGKIAKLQLVITLVVFFLSLVFTALPLFYQPGNALEYMFANGGRIYAVINIALVLCVVLVFFKDYCLAIKSIADFKLNTNTVLFILTFFVIIHDIACLILQTAGLNNIKLYTLAVVFASAIKCLGDYFKGRTTLRSLALIMKSKSLQSVQPIENKADANAIALGITEQGDPHILYCAQVETGDNLTTGIGPRKDESRYYTYSSIAVILFGLVSGLVIYIKNKDGGAFFTALMSAVALCLPIMGDTVRAINVYFENLRLHKLGAAATEYEGIRSVGKANGIAMDVSDIFTAEVSAFRTVPGAGMKKSDAAVFASAVTIAADSLIGNCFEDFIKQLEINLPEAEDVRYEERLGYTAWVKDRHILVGNREMLILHSIPAPSESEERLYGKNRFVMYLAVDGRLTATFLVNYKMLSSLKKLSVDFNRTGLVLMLTSKEPCLSQKEVAKRLRIDTAGVKVLSTKCCDIINEYKNSKSSKIASGLVCSKKSRSLLPLVVSTHRLYVSDKFLFNFHLLGQGLGLLLLVLSHVLNMPLFFNPLTIIILHLAWGIGAYMLVAKKEKP